MENVLVTGGAGFIGSHFVKRILRADDVARVTVLDALTYAGSITNLGEAFLSPKLEFVQGNILDEALVTDLMACHTAVVHFAAESHVDRSFLEGGTFLMSNVVGTHILLEAAKRTAVEKFVHVSTDEVYGPLLKGAARERDPLNPSMPYAVSKAASDLVALSAYTTDGVPVCVTRSSNQYGPGQHPEKIIPLFLTALVKGLPVTLHGRGEHVRNWLHVEDNCAGLELVLRDGVPGEIYNLGGGTDLTNKELTERILHLYGASWDLVTYVPDRKANDLRYAMDWSKAASTLGYQPGRDLDEGLAVTADWYQRHPDRWAPLRRNPGAPMAQIQVAAREERGPR
ncbi:dTDP-glucose 4,6-dehydratase [Streptomyces sp. NPDC058284]|uniref:dTDP-glucose 4,6-dehydratase n=1 Tax=unclassified Streptomyces TaxID=2593676 RepID=UPI00366114A6